MWHVAAIFLMGTANLLTWCILIFVLACQYFLREFIGWTLCRQSLFIVVQTELLKYSHSTICATSGPYHAVHWPHFLWSRVEESQHVLWQWVMIAGKDICSRLKQMLKNSVNQWNNRVATTATTRQRWLKRWIMFFLRISRYFKVIKFVSVCQNWIWNTASNSKYKF